MNENNLRNVAKALRESTRPDLFNMKIYVWGEHRMNDPLLKTRYKEDFCGTPACALGHYAARKDLQDFLTVKPLKAWDGQDYPAVVYSDDVECDASYDDLDLRTHFEINYEEAEELFGAEGCVCAKTPEQAAAYIEYFIERKKNEQA